MDNFLEITEFLQHILSFLLYLNNNMSSTLGLLCLICKQGVVQGKLEHIWAHGTSL